MAALNNIPTTLAYTGGQTLLAPGTERLLVHVRNAAVFYQLGDGWPVPVWRDEVFAPPGTYGLDRKCDAIRVRSVNAGAAAQVTIDAEAADG